MMLNVFFVQPGYMLQLEFEETVLNCVSVLKQKIAERLKIPEEDQVLLLSGGQEVNSDQHVCQYGSGTESCPFYLFALNYEVSPLDVYSQYKFDDDDLLRKLSNSQKLPVSLATVKKRTQIAQEFSEYAKQIHQFCKDRKDEQHNQQQGWATAMANLDVATDHYKLQWDILLSSFNDFVDKIPILEEYFNGHVTDLQILENIPLVQALVNSESVSTYADSDNEALRRPTLKGWLQSHMKCENLEDLYRQTYDYTKKVRDWFPTFKKEVADILQSVRNPDLIQIEGLPKRLYNLEELIHKIKIDMEQQIALGQSIAQNKASATQVNDASILPDLCATHQDHMELIEKCHKRLVEKRTQIIKSKIELCKTLCNRVNWLHKQECRLRSSSETGKQLIKQLDVLQQHLNFFQQVKEAPIVYMAAIVEVVRRKTFSRLFSLWATDLACRHLAIYNEELTRRKEFNLIFDTNFCTHLIPGLNDIPPSFAIEAPDEFDTQLPNITIEDVERLNKELVEFADKLVMPDMSNFINFYTRKIEAGIEGEEDKVDEARAVSDLDRTLKPIESAPELYIVKGEKDNDSQTDTEEFERIGQSPLERAQEAEPKTPEKQDASTSTEVRNQILPPKKPPRSFRATQSLEIDPSQRTLSISTNESFTNLKNISLDSIDELSSIKNFTSATTTESSFNSHYNIAIGEANSGLSEGTNLSTLSKSHMTQSHYQSSLMLSRSKSVSPQSPSFHDNQSPQTADFATDEFYIDESLPSSVGTGNSQGSEFVRQLDTANIVVAMLQDNLETSRSEHDKLMKLFRALGDISNSSISFLRADLSEFKTAFLVQSQFLRKECDELSSSWDNFYAEMKRSEKEAIDNIITRNEVEKGQILSILEEKERFIEQLKQDKVNLEERITNEHQQRTAIEEALADQQADNNIKMEELLQQKDLETERRLKELNEILKMEHKAEIESIKSRFKLMTMERSPSVSSLEKEKSGDFTSITGHSSLLVKQMTENFEVDKENAIQEERKKWERKLEQESKSLAQYSKKILVAVKRQLEEKERQIDILREREKNLSLEIIKHKTTIQQLTEYQEDSDPQDLRKEVEALEIENQLLLQKLKVANSMEGSLEQSRSDAKNLRIAKCKVGDNVLVLWDETYTNFRILQESRHMYFLHSDSMAILDLNVSNGKPNKNYCIGKVQSKELCESTKEDNRYKLPVGTIFFLVSVGPKLQEVVSQQDDSSEDNIEQAEAAVEDNERSAVEAKDKLLEELIEKDSENRKQLENYKVAIEQLNEKLRAKLKSEEAEILRQEKSQLEKELAQLKQTVMSMSLTLCEGAPESSSSSAELTRSEIVSSRRDRLNIDSCKVGNIVLLLWDETHHTFKVVQDSKHTYFLHSDSLEKLGLTISHGKPNKLYTVGEVYDKEFCQARKSENRYKMPKGTKFFRVKVKPVSALHEMPLLLTTKHVMSASQAGLGSSATVLFQPLLEEAQESESRESSGSGHELEESVSVETESDRKQDSGLMPEQKESTTDNVFIDSGIEAIAFPLADVIRYEDDDQACKEVIEQSTYVKTNWFEAMFRSMFSK